MPAFYLFWLNSGVTSCKFSLRCLFLFKGINYLCLALLAFGGENNHRRTANRSVKQPKGNRVVNYIGMLISAKHRKSRACPVGKVKGFPVNAGRAVFDNTASGVHKGYVAVNNFFGIFPACRLSLRRCAHRFKTKGIKHSCRPLGKAVVLKISMQFKAVTKGNKG